ncbi:MAG: glycosyltransferase, partial [Sphingomonadales bacterium]
PVIYTYHTRLEHYAHFVPLPGLLFRNLISHYLIRRFSNKCQGVVVPTHSAEEYLRVIGVTTNILVQPTGIDVERFRAVDEQRLAERR